MQKYTFAEVMTNRKKQRDFLKQIDRIIMLAKKHGYIEAAFVHSANRKLLGDAIELFSTTKQKTVAIIHADYEEFRPETFRGYTVDDNRRFETLDEATKYAASIADLVMKRSSVDDYETDLRDSRRKASNTNRPLLAEAVA